MCRCGVFLFTLAGKAANMEVCVFDAHHLATTNLPTAFTHDGRVSTAGERRAAVVVSSIKTRLVLNCTGGEKRRREIKNMSLIVIFRPFLLSFFQLNSNI